MDQAEYQQALKMRQTIINLTVIGAIGAALASLAILAIDNLIPNMLPPWISWLFIAFTIINLCAYIFTKITYPALPEQSQPKPEKEEKQ